MHLVQILLPLRDARGERFAAACYRRVAAELTERFGGLTAYARAPAEGLWERHGEAVERDDILVYEVMVEDLQERWWAGYRRELEARFEQEELVVRALAMTRL